MSTALQFHQQPIIVLAHGCFDLLHLGHIRHLQEASKLGQLTVSVTADRHVAKGTNRPHFTAEERAEALRALDCVDDVIITDAPDAVDLIEELKPHIYVKGIDYADKATDIRLDAELAALEKIGGKFIVTGTKKYSSSRILNGETYPPEVVEYLATIRDRLPQIEKAFADIRKMKVAFVGETIIDEYVYVDPLAKPSKEFVLCAAHRGFEAFAGGIVAASGHLRHLCERELVTQPPSHEIVKRRYVERGFTRKLFEVYSSPHIELKSHDWLRFHDDLIAKVREADVVVVIDFGHGLIDDRARENFYANAKYLAINAQTNAGNQGFNSITKYEAADYVCVDMPEARLAKGDASATPTESIDFLQKHFGGAHVIVTHGREGAYFSGGGVPAFAQKPIDTMGAGDCFLAITAPLIASGLGIEEAAFVGSVAAGMKTGIVGHREAINGETLLQTVRTLLA